MNNINNSGILRKLQVWKTKLLDVSHGNRLLYFKHTKSSSTAITFPDPDELFQQIVTKGRTLTFPLLAQPSLFDLEESAESIQLISAEPRRYKPGQISSPLPEKQLSQVLYNLRSRARSALEEQGFNILYLTFGMLRWSETEGSEAVLSPILLVPVVLERAALREPYALTMLEEDIVLNPTLLHKLESDFGLSLPEPSGDLDGTGFSSYFAQIQTHITGKKNWDVQPDVTLGTFSFQNLSLFKDLEMHQNLYVAHPLIAALGGNQALPTTHDLVEAQDLDNKVAAITVFQVVDADSSQQEAIQAAKMGNSFVLQGPPGTGKSQTITNIIAEFLAEGKKVLFVSEKIAALEVVQNRLSDAGLGEFCLQLHGHKRDRREVVKELVQSLEAPVHQLKPAYQTVLQSLESTKRALNDYARAVYIPRFALQFSAYRAQGELAKLNGAPTLIFPLGSVSTIGPVEFANRQSILGRFVAMPGVIDNFDLHPWQGSKLRELTFATRDRLVEALDTLLQVLPQLITDIHSLAEASALRSPTNLSETNSLIDVLRKYRPALFSLDLDLLKLKFEKRYARFYRFLVPGYRADLESLTQLRLTSTNLDYAQACEDLRLAATVQRLLSNGKSPNPNESNTGETVKHCVATLDKIHVALKVLADVFDGVTPSIQGTTLFNVDYVDLTQWLEFHRKEMDALAQWASFLRLTDEARQQGLDGFVQSALNKKLPATQWRTTYLASFYKAFLDATWADSEALRRFDSQAHNATIEQFRDLDRQQMVIAQARIQANIGERRPKSSWVDAASAEQTILQREAAKKRRLKSLRRLCSEIPRLITDLRPCLLMSPRTVSMFLDPRLFKFDLVVFDEASQIPPEGAVGAILRGAQTIVVGDSQQLPPTRFFSVMADDDIDENAPDEDYVFDSILEECQGVSMAQKMLLWHYRSRHESLIAFSNYHFYNNKLFTFPSPQQQSGEIGVSFVHVPDGIYRRGTARRNDIEARRVVDLIFDHMRDTPERSLGVVTLGLTQMDAIRLECERRRLERPDLDILFNENKSEPFFVKNLESVQGDERDVIIFSVGFGKDEAGKLTLNFGPINRAGGERRLNVAVSRARYKVALVSSITPEEIDLTRTNSRGARLLRQYMEIARNGLKALYADTSASATAETESPFEQAVYEALLQKGYSVHLQVGVSGYRIDLAVVHPDDPGQYLLGIECDGATYHSGKTARDRDRLRQQVLEGLGWRIYRIWSRDWINNRARELEKAIAAIETALKNAKSPPPITKSAPASSDITDSAKAFLFETASVPKIISLPKNVETYKQAPLREVGPLYGSGGTSNFSKVSHDQIARGVINMVVFEGPIHVDLVFERILKAWEIKRAGNRIQSKLDEILYVAERSRKITRKDKFLWPTGITTPKVRVPDSKTEPRNIEHIAPEEIIEAAFVCITEARSLSRADLATETAQLLGYSRLNAKITGFMEAAINTLINVKRVTAVDDVLHLPS